MSASTAGLVSCLMVTMDRTALALRAITCYLMQDYPIRELIIVDGGTGELATRVVELGRKDIVWIRAPTDKALLGDLRNIALLHAKGEFFVQWDDDDWYAPHRISSQLTALADKEACLLKRWIIAWPEREIYGISHSRPWEGSILARLRTGITYRSMRLGEDTEMIERCINKNSMVLLDQPELYVYFIHGENTFPSTHFERLVNKPDFLLLSRKDVEALRSRLGLD